MARGASESARAEAERISRLKDEFLATLSHELRTPLTRHPGLGEGLSLARRATRPARQGLEAIERNARAQATAHRGLARHEPDHLRQGAAGHPDRPTSPGHRGGDRNRPPCGRSEGRRLRRDARPAAGPVHGRSRPAPASDLESALQRGQVHAQGAARSRCVLRAGELAARDQSGATREIGIEPEFLPHVFDRFRQADSSTTRARRLGLGLSIVKQLVELHGGTVRAKSEGEGHGTTFIVRCRSRPCTETRGEEHPENHRDGCAMRC